MATVSKQSIEKAKSLNQTTEQRSIIILVFRYCNANYKNDIPFEIIELIHRYYEANIYWRIKGDDMKQFLNAKNGDKMYNKYTINIQDIEFQCVLCPNGRRPRSKGSVAIYCEIKQYPQDIEYCIVSMKLVSESSNNNYTFLRILNKKGTGFNMKCGKLDEYKDLEFADFNYSVDLLHIKYKANAKKTDFISKIKMKTHVECEWVIDDKKQLKSLQIMDIGQWYSYNDDKNNWGIRIAPKGSSHGMKNPGSLVVLIGPIAIPFGVNVMEFEYYMELECESKGVLCKTSDMKEVHFFIQTRREYIDNRMIMECPDLNIDDVFNEEWIKIKMRVDIKNIYDQNEQQIKRDRWNEYGFYD